MGARAARARRPPRRARGRGRRPARGASCPTSGISSLVDPETGTRVEADSSSAELRRRVRGRRARAPRRAEVATLRRAPRAARRGRAPTTTGCARSEGACDELPGPAVPARPGRRSRSRSLALRARPPASRRRYVVRFPATATLAAVAPAHGRVRRTLPPALLCLALAGLALALARPEATVAVPVERASVMLVTDTSGSMNADRRRARPAGRRQGRPPTRFLDARAGAAAGRPRRLRRRPAHGAAPDAGPRRRSSRRSTALQADGGTATGDALDARAAGARRPRRRSRRRPRSCCSPTARAQTGQRPGRGRRSRRARPTSRSTPSRSARPTASSSTPAARRMPVPPDPEALRAGRARSPAAARSPPRTPTRSTRSTRRSARGSARKTEKREISAGFAAAGLLLLLARARDRLGARRGSLP